VTYVQATGYDSGGRSIAWASWTDSLGDPERVPDPLSTACGWVVEQVTVRGAALAVAYNDAGEQLVRCPDAVTPTPEPPVKPAEGLPNSLRGLGPMPAPFAGPRHDNHPQPDPGALRVRALAGWSYALVGAQGGIHFWVRLCDQCGGVSDDCDALRAEKLKDAGPWELLP